MSIFLSRNIDYTCALFLLQTMTLDTWLTPVCYIDDLYCEVNSLAVPTLGKPGPGKINTYSEIQFSGALFEEQH